jgi:hypothetical protein
MNDNNLTSIFERYIGDGDATLTATGFCRWVESHHPELSESMGKDAIEQFAEQYLSAPLSPNLVLPKPLAM